MPSHVRVSGGANGGGDSHAAGRARLKLKLAAIAYSNGRHGIDADVGLNRAGLALLCAAAIEYYESLPQMETGKRPVDPSFQLDNGA